MNRCTDVITEKRIEGKTESDRIKRLETRLTELQGEKDIIKREKGHLTNENKILRKKHA